MKPETAAVRASYKVFLDSLAGKDFLEYLLTLEVTARANGRKYETAEMKAFEMIKMDVGYGLRTYLADMSKPAPSQSKRAGSE